MILLRSLKVSLIILIVSIVATIPVSYAGTEYKVKSTDSLSRIVDKFYKNSKLSRSQIYIGILAENPSAFSFGNINYLKGKQRLNIPDSDDLLAMEKEDAAKLVAEHNNYARKGKKVRLNPPFKNYMPKNSSTVGDAISALAEKQQVTSQELEKLDSETEELRIRLERLVADKEAMDAELRQLDALIKK